MPIPHRSGTKHVRVPGQVFNHGMKCFYESKGRGLPYGVGRGPYARRRFEQKQKAAERKGAPARCLICYRFIDRWLWLADWNARIVAVRRYKERKKERRRREVREWKAVPATHAGFLRSLLAERLEARRAERRRKHKRNS